MTTAGTKLEVCPGEYDHVARRSSDLDSLKLAHATQCDKAEAERMIRALARQHLSEADAGALRVEWGARRGRGGQLSQKKRELRYEYERQLPDGTTKTIKRYRMRYTGVVTHYIKLPSKAMAQGGPWWVHETRVDRQGRTRWRSGSRLRVGLVLHEFAHVMNPREQHNQKFVDCLDSLIRDWRASQGNVTAVAAGPAMPAEGAQP